MPDYVKRCQSRVKQITKSTSSIPMPKCREVYSSIVVNYEEPTEEELGRVVQALIAGDTVEVESETTTIEPVLPTPETFDIPVEDMPCLQPPGEAEAAIAPTNEQGQTEPQTNLNLSLAQEAELATSSPEDKNKSTGIIPRQSTDSGEITQNHGGITQAQVTQAITQAIAQTGQQGNAEAIQILTALADELSSDIADTQEMVTALVTAYLGKRQYLLSSAIGTLTNLRSAQTESFQAGLDQNFFGAKDQSKREFLAKVGTMFN